MLSAYKVTPDAWHPALRFVCLIDLCSIRTDRPLLPSALLLRRRILCISLCLEIPRRSTMAVSIVASRQTIMPITDANALSPFEWGHNTPTDYHDSPIVLATTARLLRARRGLLSMPLFAPLMLHLCHIALLSLTAYSLPPIGWHIAVYSRGLYSRDRFRVHPLPSASGPRPSVVSPTVRFARNPRPSGAPSTSGLVIVQFSPQSMSHSTSFPDVCFLRSRSFLPPVSRRSPYSDSTAQVRPIRLHR